MSTKKVSWKSNLNHDNLPLKNAKASYVNSNC